MKRSNLEGITKRKSMRTLRFRGSTSVGTLLKFNLQTQVSGHLKLPLVIIVQPVIVRYKKEGRNRKVRKTREAQDMQ
jgi:hypothetical protein